MKLLLSSLLLMVSCTTVITKKSTTTTELLPVDIDITVDDTTKLDLLNPTYHTDAPEDSISISVPKHREVKDSSESVSGGLKAKVVYTTKWDSGRVSTIIESVNVGGERSIITVKEEETATPYCNIKLYIFIGIFIGSGIMYIIRVLLR